MLHYFMLTSIVKLMKPYNKAFHVINALQQTLENYGTPEIASP